MAIHLLRYETLTFQLLPILIHDDRRMVQAFESNKPQPVNSRNEALISFTKLVYWPMKYAPVSSIFSFPSAFAPGVAKGLHPINPVRDGCQAPRAATSVEP